MDLDLNTNNEYEKKLLEVETQLNMTTYIYDYLKDEQYHFSLLPVNTGISDMELMRLINEYNKELLERERLLNTMKPDNPTIVNQNINITALRKTSCHLSQESKRDSRLPARISYARRTISIHVLATCPNRRESSIT